MLEPIRPESKYFLRGRDSISYEEYSTFFKVGQEKIWGEKSTSYADYLQVANKILSILEDPFLLVSTRNPVERTISNYYFSCKNNLETRTLEEVFVEEKRPPELKDKISTDPFAYLERSSYINYLPQFLSTFNPLRTKILVFERLISDNPSWKELMNWLGIYFNKDLLSYKEPVNELSRTEFPPIPPHVISFLYEYFKPLNESWFEYIGFDIPEWRPVSGDKLI